MTPVSIAAVVARAHRRLSRLHVRAFLGQRAAFLCGAVGVCAAVRPLLWPLGDMAPSRAVVLAIALGLGGLVVVSAGIAIWAWRRRPSALAAARQLDSALGLAEVVASGYAFEATEAKPMESIAVARANHALAGIDIVRALPPDRRSRSRRERLWLGLAVLGAALGIAFGAVDRLVVDRWFHPVTARELAAAAALAKAADAADAKDSDPKTAAVADAARRAAEATRRGDRKRAHEALEDMRKAMRERDAAEREQARALRALRDEVDGKSRKSEAGDSDADAKRGEKASDALARMMKELDTPEKAKDPEAVRKLAERLQRAESAARAAAAAAAHEREKSGAGKPSRAGSGPSETESRWSRAAAALKEAREAAARGDSEAAKKALERAEKEIEALEKAKAEAARAGEVAQMSESGSKLDRSLDSGGAGKPGARDELAEEDGEGSGGKPGENGKDGKGSGPSGGDKSPPGAGGPDEGGGEADRTPGAEKRRVTVNGNLQARADVRQGERAVGVIEGMGKGGDPKAYREIFPSYETVVEDGLKEELVPAARRPTVRKYFSSIRPGEEGK